MAHQSENARRLAVTEERGTLAALGEAVHTAPGDILLLVPPYGRTIGYLGRPASYLAFVQRLANRLAPEGVFCILTTPQDAAEMICVLDKTLRFQLWVAVKLKQPRTGGCGLPEGHAALLVFSKYKSPLRHTKTRIGYTYCPACDKTTKDYGGKKHTYHHYGTLLSDVWRDIAWSPNGAVAEIAARLADLFGLPPHRRLRVLDFRHAAELKPAAPPVRGLFEEATGAAHPAHVESRLIQGDCLKALRRLKDDSIDFCFADPPYNLAKTYDTWDDAMEIREYFQWCDQWLRELARALKPGRTCAVLNIPLWAVRHFQFMKTCLAFQNWIVWEGLGLPVRMIMPSHYSIVCFSKGALLVPPGQAREHPTLPEYQAGHCLREFFCARPNCVRDRRERRVNDTAPITDLWWDIHRLKHNARRVDHPCQLPPALMRRLIAYFTEKGEVVLDPFNGVGTTTLCARQLERGYVGIELSEKYHALAAERHDLLERGGDPFAKTNGVPAAKNSRVRRLGQQQYAVPKKTLQLEVKAIAHKLGRLPTRADVARHSQYPMEYFEQYFASWGEVCAAARTTGMSEVRAG